MLELFVLAFSTALGAFILLMWIPSKRRVLGFAGILDAVFSIGLVMISGVDGIVLAFIAGILFHLMLKTARWWYGYEVLDLKTFSWVTGE